MRDTNVDEVNGRVDDSAKPADKLPEVPPHLGRDLALYTLARFGFIAVVAIVLLFFRVPVLVAVAVGVVVALPLSMVLLRGWHTRVSAGLAARGMVRRAARERLRAELRGELAGDSREPADGAGTGDDDRTAGS